MPGNETSIAYCQPPRHKDPRTSAGLCKCHIYVFFLFVDTESFVGEYGRIFAKPMQHFVLGFFCRL